MLDADPRARRLTELLSDRYELLAFLGHGGFAAVYKVRSRNLDRLEALKVLLATHEDDPEFAGRFQQEARVAASLDHPTIVRVFDFGHTQELFWYSMQFVDGPTLTKELAKAPMNERRAASLLVPVCDALAYAHGKGIVHRDIKPDNVMLGPTGRPVLMDFGIAKSENSLVKTRTGLILGSPAFLSPEQVRGEPLDGRSDIYSLGITIYQMVSGTRPFTADDRTQLMIKRLREDPVPLDRVRPGLDPRLVALVMRCLSRDRKGRPTAAEVRDELQEMEDTWRGLPPSPSSREAVPPPPPAAFLPTGDETAPTADALRETSRTLSVPTPPHVNAPPPPLPRAAAAPAPRVPSPPPPAPPPLRPAVPAPPAPAPGSALPAKPRPPRTALAAGIALAALALLAAAAFALRPFFRASRPAAVPEVVPTATAAAPAAVPTPVPIEAPSPVATVPPAAPTVAPPPAPTPAPAARREPPSERRAAVRAPRERQREEAPAPPPRREPVVRAEIGEQPSVKLPPELASEYAGKSTGLKVIIGEDGTVKSAKVIGPVSPACAACDMAALEAVKAWRFTPAKDRDGNPVESTVAVPVRF